MKITVKYFGQLAEAAGKELEVLDSLEPLTILQLRQAMEKKYPDLKKTDFRLAANLSLVDELFLITKDCEIAFLPPFTGG